MFHRKSNPVGGQGTAYTSLPNGTTGGYSNYPQGQEPQNGGYGNDNNVRNVKPGYGYEPSNMQQPQQKAGYDGYVQQAPMGYGPTGTPLEPYPRKRSNRTANWIAAAFVAIWACTWPCHGPCCCGL